jgi:hypothetical protein
MLNHARETYAGISGRMMMMNADNDKHRELRSRGGSKITKEIAVPSFRPRKSGLQYMSLARPFHDLRSRDQVFLVIVVFKFEFVVRRSGTLNLFSQYGSDAFFSTRSIDALTRPWSFGEAITSAR